MTDFYVMVGIFIFVLAFAAYIAAYSATHSGSNVVSNACEERGLAMVRIGSTRFCIDGQKRLYQP